MAIVAYVKALQVSGNAGDYPVDGSADLPDKKIVLDEDEAMASGSDSTQEGSGS